MIDASEIKPDMAVVTTQAEHVAVVDHMQGQDVIKLKKDEHGVHHMIPLSWVIVAEGGVIKVNRTLTQLKQDWQSVPAAACESPLDTHL